MVYIGEDDSRTDGVHWGYNVPKSQKHTQVPVYTLEEAPSVHPFGQNPTPDFMPCRDPQCTPSGQFFERGATWEPLKKYGRGKTPQNHLAPIVGPLSVHPEIRNLYSWGACEADSKVNVPACGQHANLHDAALKTCGQTCFFSSSKAQFEADTVVSPACGPARYAANAGHRLRASI